MRPGYFRVRCMVCGRTREQAGHISSRGKCAACAVTLVDENNTGIRERRGPAFQRWRLGTVAAVLPRDLVGVMFREGIFADGLPDDG